MSGERLRLLELRWERQRRVNRLPLRRLRDRKNPLELYNPVQFKVRYHMHKETASFVASLISEKLSAPRRRGVYIPPVIQVLTVLRFYATGDFQMTHADLHNFSQPTISKLVRRVSTAIARLRSRFVKFPNFEDAERTRRAFYEIASFPGKKHCLYLSYHVTRQACLVFYDRNYRSN